MGRRLAVVFLAAVGASTCVARNRINTTCDWTNDAPSRLDIRRSADVQHLVNDATVAEDLAIRFADATRGHRSGHFAGLDEYAAARERCMASLVATVASSHSVDAQQVHDLRGRRPFGVDLLVGLSFVMMYLVIAAGAADRVLSRFPVDEPTAMIVASVAVGTGLSACGVLALGLWANVI
jgi:hypothetical protein